MRPTRVALGAMSYERKPLPAEVFCLSEGQSSDVSSRSRQALDEAGANRIQRREDDRSRRGDPLGGGGRRRTLGDEHVHFEVDQFGDETWQPVGVTVCISVFDDDVLLLDIAKPSESCRRPSIAAGSEPDVPKNR